MLDEQDKQECLKIARSTLELFLRQGKLPKICPESKKLQLNQGAFVTLQRGEELCGCIGTFAVSKPLYKTIQTMAVAAATEDPRFSPVRYEDLATLTIEISVLSRRLPVQSPGEIKVGSHGLYITKGKHCGVLLPQVATENNWDRETFLSHTCLKAGLAGDAWQGDGVAIEVFSAEVFGER